MRKHKRSRSIFICIFCAVTLLLLLSAALNTQGAGHVSLAANTAAAAVTSGVPQAAEGAAAPLLIRGPLALQLAPEDGIFIVLVITAVAALILLFILMRRFLKK